MPENENLKKVAFYTLGCKLNYSETSSVSRLFEEKGFTKVEFTDSPDVFIINTCSVTDHADKKCKKVVKEALKHSPNAFIAIMGCYAQLKPTEISEIPGVDVVLGASEKFRLFDLIPSFEKSEQPKIFATDIAEATTFHHAHSIQDRTRTFLKVQDGCDYTCSFCTIPLARGSSRSDTIASIVSQAKKIAENGVKEIVLTGVNIGDYGIINGKRELRFLDLIKELDNIDGIDRFRISSIEPNLLSNDIIEFVAYSKRFVPHFHIPLQSGNNEILKLMKRRYLRELYADRVSNIRELMPDCCIGVDVITGFPGETKDHFLDTYQFLNELDINYLHVFTYSERENTHATGLKGKVPVNIRQERTTMLRTLSEKKRHAFYESQLGKTATVLFEQEEKDGTMCGFTENYVKVSAKYDPLLVNELKTIKLHSILPNDTVSVEEVTEYVHHI